jgi:hypothetical protein
VYDSRINLLSVSSIAMLAATNSDRMKYGTTSQTQRVCFPEIYACHIKFSATDPCMTNQYTNSTQLQIRKKALPNLNFCTTFADVE